MSQVYQYSSGVTGASRVPTRCPACKGAVTQRMPGRALGSVWCYCLFCNHAWKSRLDDAYAKLDGQLTGDVFVVTTSGKRQPLGSVVLNAIPDVDEVLQEHVERETAHGDLERRKLQDDIDALAASLETARAEEDRLWKIQKRDEENLQKANAWSVAYNKTKNITKQLKDLRARRQKRASLEHFFRDLPSPISTARTDADGKFTLAIPRLGRYGIVARASREVGEDKQIPAWFVWVNLDGEPSKRLVLNNANIVGAKSPDSEW